MNSRTIVRKTVVALVFGLAALASWAITQSDAPQIEASNAQLSNG